MSLGFVAAVVTARASEVDGFEERAVGIYPGDAALSLADSAVAGLAAVRSGKVFLHRAGTVILLVTIVLWVLANLPLAHGKMPAASSTASPA